MRFSEHTRIGLVYLDRIAAAAPLHTASHDSNCTAATTAATAAEAGATTSDGNDSDDRPEGHPSDWRPEGCFDAQRWPGTDNDCSDVHDQGEGGDAVLSLAQRVIGDDAP